MAPPCPPSFATDQQDIEEDEDSDNLAGEEHSEDNFFWYFKLLSRFQAMSDKPAFNILLFSTTKF